MKKLCVVSSIAVLLTVFTWNAIVFKTKTTAYTKDAVLVSVVVRYFAFFDELREAKQKMATRLALSEVTAWRVYWEADRFKNAFKKSSLFNTFSISATLPETIEMDVKNWQHGRILFEPKGGKR